MKYLLLFLVSIFSLSGLTCEVSFYNFNYHTGKDLKVKNLARSIKNCDEQKLEKLEGIIQDYNGTVSARYLTVITGGTISISPERISIINLSKYLENNKTSKNLKLHNVSILSSNNFIRSDARLKIECLKCSRAGEHQLKIVGEKVIWGKASFVAPTGVLVANNDLQAFSTELEGSMFELEKRWVLDPENYYTKKSELSFYKISKPLQKGQLLKKDDLMPKNIVHIGKTVEVILNSDNVKIVTKGIAQSSGHISDNVIVKNQKTNKQYNAKIIGIDKVKVEL